MKKVPKRHMDQFTMFLYHWLLIGKQFIEALNKKIEVAA